MPLPCTTPLVRLASADTQSSTGLERTLVKVTLKPDVDWSANTAPDDDIQLLFLNFCNDYGFGQYVGGRANTR